MTGGCLNSKNTIINNSVSSPENSSVIHYFSPSDSIKSTDFDAENEESVHFDDAASVSSSYSPNFHAGMIIADDEDNLKLVTVYKKISGKYGTRSLLKASDGEAYLIKDASFKELGSTYDEFKSINKMYPFLYDDLNYNSDTNSYYNYKIGKGAGYTSIQTVKIRL